MKVTLTIEINRGFDNLFEKCLDSGLWKNKSEIINDALRHFHKEMLK